ncbi:hypothetical protein XA1311A_15430 [Xanthomonas arboricola]|nr:hypothetical protein XA1311A_15430 [Xanthomonas arboricola]CAE6745668.1 hypothetical protein XA1311A_15430 [Xanthomonas arboricola]
MLVFGGKLHELLDEFCQFVCLCIEVGKRDAKSVSHFLSRFTIALMHCPLVSIDANACDIFW